MSKYDPPRYNLFHYTEYWESEYKAYMIQHNEGEYVKYVEYLKAEMRGLYLEDELEIMKQQYEKLDKEYEELVERNRELFKKYTELCNRR